MEVAMYLKRPDSIGSTSIFARISYYGHRLKYYLPESVPPKFWNKETQTVRETKKFPEYAEINNALSKYVTEIKNIVRRFIDDNGKPPTTTALRDLLDSKIKFREQTGKPSFFQFFKEIIDATEKGLRINPKTGKPIVRDTTKTYTTVYNHLQEFQKQKKFIVDFETIDLNFYLKYTDYLTSTAKLSANTIGKHIQTIKLIMNEATEKGINTNLKYKSKRFITQKEDADNIYLNESEVADLYALDLSGNKSHEKVRDLFIVGCLTGLRFSDFSKLTPADIKDGFFEITQVKTGGSIMIPVHPIVAEIMRKYGGLLPPAISNQKMNDYLKLLCANVESLKGLQTIEYTKAGEKRKEAFLRSELVTTHTARRSFATNEYLAGTPVLTIMAITGHKTEKAFLQYIKVTPKAHAELLQKTWQKREAEKKRKLKAKSVETHSTT